MIKKLIQHDKSAGLGDFDDEESEKNEKSLHPGASTDVILGDYAEVIEENIMGLLCLSGRGSITWFFSYSILQIPVWEVCNQ